MPCSWTQQRTTDALFTITPNYAFITSSMVVPGALGGTDGGDALCQALATDAGLPGHFIALLPSSTQTLSQRIGSARGWVRRDGRPFLDQLSDGLNGNERFFYPLVLDQDGGMWVDTFVVTGAQPSGAAAPGTGGYGGTCSGWTDATVAAQAAIGHAGWASGSDWVGLPVVQSSSCSAPAHLYCFGVDRNAPLVVAPPGPVRLAFTSASFFSPGASQRAGADAICANEAADAGLPGTYAAFMALDTASAGSRFSSSGPPWARVDGVLLARTASALLTLQPSTMPLALLTTDAKGNTRNDAGVYLWTGATAPDATSGGDTYACGDWRVTTTSGSSPFVGCNTKWISGWWFSKAPESGDPDCSNQTNKVYCLQQ